MRLKEEFEKQFNEAYFKNRNAETKHKIEALRWIAYFDPTTILDYGCGQGIRVHELVKQGAIAYGYDISKWAIENPYGLSAGRIFTELPNGKFDLIICYDLLEHLYEDEIDDVLHNISSRLSSEGAVIFSIPFIGDPNLNLDHTHVTKKTRVWWENKLTAHNLRVTRENYTKTGSGDDYFLFPHQMIIARALVPMEAKK